MAHLCDVINGWCTVQKCLYTDKSRCCPGYYLIGAYLHCPDGWEGGRLECGHSMGADSSVWQAVPFGDTSHSSKSSGTVGRTREVHTACPRVGILYTSCRLPRFREELDVYKSIDDIVEHGCVSKSSSSYLQRVPL
jgi:hypothetical protein